MRKVLFLVTGLCIIFFRLVLKHIFIQEEIQWEFY